jgi:hypothetical protein
VTGVLPFLPFENVSRRLKAFQIVLQCSKTIKGPLLRSDEKRFVTGLTAIKIVERYTLRVNVQTRLEHGIFVLVYSSLAF